jgi:hypothetical protein
LRTLFSSELWRQLEEVSLASLYLQARSVPNMAEAIAGSNLRSLNLAGFARTTAATNALRDAPDWGQLATLSLAWMNVPVERLLRHPGLARLTYLGLAHVALQPQQLDRLAGCEALAGLRRLSIGHRMTPPMPGVMAAITKSPSLKRLHWLNTWDSEKNVLAFVKSPNAAHIRWLNAGNDLTTRIAKAIAASPYMSQLTTLHANSSKLTDAGAVAIAKSKVLVNLTYMDLLGCPLTAKGLRALLEAEDLGWVGISKHDLKKDDLKEMYRLRYGNTYWGYVLDAGSVYES